MYDELLHKIHPIINETWKCFRTHLQNEQTEYDKLIEDLQTIGEGCIDDEIKDAVFQGLCKGLYTALGKYENERGIH